MKIRDSGMPDEKVWDSFFEAESILEKLELTTACFNIVEFGCGYGTFTIPAARIVRGTVYALDIEPKMLDITRIHADEAQLTNIECIARDFIRDGTGLADASVDYAMVFNILHAEQPVKLLQETYRVILDGGLLGITHWNYDATTPRGPAMEIRPRPEQCNQWAVEAGFTLVSDGILDLPSYHYGMVLRR